MIRNASAMLAMVDSVVSRTKKDVVICHEQMMRRLFDNVRSVVAICLTVTIFVPNEKRDHKYSQIATASRKAWRSGKLSRRAGLKNISRKNTLCKNTKYKISTISTSEIIRLS